MILSFDGVSTESMDCVLKDEITCIGECNPLHGPRVEALIRILEEGRTPENSLMWKRDCMLMMILWSL